MKKINEDVQITDPALAQQYSNGQTQLLNKDRQINALQKQINNIEQSKNDIAKKMAEIEKKAGQTEPDEVQQNLDQQQVAADAAVQSSTVAPIGESLIVKESIDSDDDRGRLEAIYDRLTDELVTLQAMPVSEQEPNYEELIWHVKREIAELDEELYSDQLMNDTPITPPSDEVDELYTKYDKIGKKLAKEFNGKNDPDQIEWYQDQLEMIKSKIGKAETKDMNEAEEEVRYSGAQQIQPNGRVYQDGNMVGWDHTKYEPQEFNMSDVQMKKSDQLEADKNDIENEIDQIKDTIGYLEDDLRNLSDSPEGQEEADTEILDRYDWGVLDYLNGGGTSEAELQQMGVANPKDVIETYQYAHPDEKELEKERIPLRKELAKYRKEAQRLQKKYDKTEEKLEALYATKYKAKRSFKSVQGEEEQKKMAPNVYDNANPMSIDNFYDLSEAYVEDSISFDNPGAEYDPEKYLFYVKITDGHEEFIAKIFKMSPDGYWFGIIKDGGDSKSFENISYDPSYDEEQIVEYLRETYDEVEIIDMNEFNNYLEGTEKPDTSDWTVKDVEESSGPTMQM